MSEGSYSSGGLSRSTFISGAAPTRPRKRIYDAEVNSEEEVLARRPVHYSGYESFKDVAPYKKGERMARYSRPRQESPPAAGGHVQTGGGGSAPQDPNKSPMMEDEDINQGLADNFEDSLCGLGTDVSSSKYNMREALHALPNVQAAVKQESISIRMESLTSSLPLPPGIVFEDSNSIDRILKLLTNDGTQDSVPPASLSQFLSHSATHPPPSSSTFSPSPSEDALSPPSPPTSHGCLQFSTPSQLSAPKLQSSNSSPDLDQHQQPPHDSSVLLTLNHHHHHSSSILEDDPIGIGTFQYILSVPTSTAVKKSEDTLSYLNQGQPYEIKIKKLGDITKCAGKKFTSFIRICFHERRFQYIEKEQLTQWHQLRPNERIIELDVPLSYGISDVQQSKHGQAVVRFDWDPNKDVAVHIKVNCISTEFTQRKHGGEKGVPFRIQVSWEKGVPFRIQVSWEKGVPFRIQIETYYNSGGQIQRLNVCGCQVKVFKVSLEVKVFKVSLEVKVFKVSLEVKVFKVSLEVKVFKVSLEVKVFKVSLEVKVFKLKGADRKHKQDRDKISKLPLEEREKFQESCECTILTT
ncbi:CP2 transcription factor, partial [Trinorchestia longiramus]